jgi:hypothetical protein
MMWTIAKNLCRKKYYDPDDEAGSGPLLDPPGVQRDSVVSALSVCQRIQVQRIGASDH